MASVLVVDDDRSIVHLFRRCLESEGLAVWGAGSSAEGIAALKDHRPDVVVLDIILPDEPGLATIQKIRDRDHAIPVILMTATSTSDRTIEAMKLGAFDYLVKPLDMTKAREVVAQALRIRQFAQAATSATKVEPDRDAAEELMIGRSAALQEVYKAIGRVANQGVNVLIRGESGTGKELVAKAIYQHGPRCGKTFLAVNCAAIPETLLESELFGHEKGSFTGAVARRIGKFEQCDGGTLFLDEIGDMTPLMQSKVLRAIQEKCFERVGGNATVETDVWLLAATHRDLEKMVASGQFRADLYYRLNTFTIALPPLRERREDIPLLVEHFLKRFGQEMGKPIDKIAPEAMKLLVDYPWPGNVRELQSTVRQAMLLATCPVLLPEFLPEDLRAHAGQDQVRAAEEHRLVRALEAFIDRQLAGGADALRTEYLKFTEEILLRRVLNHAAGNAAQAAAILGVDEASFNNIA